MSTEKIFITGMGGMEGRVLAQAAISHGYKVFGTVHNNIPDIIATLEMGPNLSSYQLDLRDIDETQKVLKDAKPDKVIHLAGHVLDNPNLGEQVYQDNLEIFDSLLTAIKQLRYQPRFVFSSAGLVYGRSETTDLIYELLPNQLPEPNRAREFYRASKIDQERRLMDTDLDFVVGRPSQHTGPGRISNVVEADIAKAIIAIQHGQVEHISVRNKLAEVDMLDARDVAQAYLTLLDSGERREVYNIGSGVSTTVEELAKTLLEVAGFPADKYPVISTGQETPTFMRYNIDKLKALGWEPKYSLKDALTSFWLDFQGSHLV